MLLAREMSEDISKQAFIQLNAIFSNIRSFTQENIATQVLISVTQRRKQ